MLAVEEVVVGDLLPLAVLVELVVLVPVPQHKLALQVEMHHHILVVVEVLLVQEFLLRLQVVQVVQVSLLYLGKYNR
jgi:hypothetical protein